MIEFYPEIRFVHIAAVYLSGGLFFLRGLTLMLGQSWSRAWSVRILAYSIDTVLLTAAFMLVTLLNVYPLVHHWLTVKVLLLIIYVIVATLALGRHRNSRSRLLLWLGALAIYLFVISIARTHHPLGFFTKL